MKRARFALYLALLQVATIACQSRGGRGNELPQAAGAPPATNAAALESAASSASASPGLAPALPPANAQDEDTCAPGVNGKYWIKVEGDGDPQLLTAALSQRGWGAPCVPAGSTNGREVIAAGCKETGKRSSTGEYLPTGTCLLLNGSRVRYYDRAGKAHDLTALPFEPKLTPSTIDGAFVTTAPLEGRSTPLKVTLHLAWPRMNY